MIAKESVEQFINMTHRLIFMLECLFYIDLCNIPINDVVDLLLITYLRRYKHFLFIALKRKHTVSLQNRITDRKYVSVKI